MYVYMYISPLPPGPLADGQGPHDDGGRSMCSRTINKQSIINIIGRPNDNKVYLINDSLYTGIFICAGAPKLHFGLNSLAAAVFCSPFVIGKRCPFS